MFENENNPFMVSPTGMGIRCDSEGLGYYRSKRGKRLHAGTDYLCNPGQPIYSPISGKIKRIAYPYKNKTYEGVVIEGEFFTIKMFYFKLLNDFLGKKVIMGERIGTAQDISKKYSRLMKPHIHLQIDRVDPGIFIRA